MQDQKLKISVASPCYLGLWCNSIDPALQHPSGKKGDQIKKSNPKIKLYTFSKGIQISLEGELVQGKYIFRLVPKIWYNLHQYSVTLARKWELYCQIVRSLNVSSLPFDATCSTSLSPSEWLEVPFMAVLHIWLRAELGEAELWLPSKYVEYGKNSAQRTFHPASKFTIFKFVKHGCFFPFQMVGHKISVDELFLKNWEILVIHYKVNIQDRTGTSI